VFIVGTDNGLHENPDNFPKALDTLLNTPTRERFRDSVHIGDHIVVMVPPTMSKDLRDRITASLQRFRDGLDVRPTTPPPGAPPGEPWFTASLDVTVEVRQVKGTDVAKAVNEMRGVRNLYYFGHGGRSGPLYDFWSVTDFPPADAFRAASFAPDAKAAFITCNSWQYAEKFTRATGVPSTGVQGTTYFGKSEVSAGTRDPQAAAGHLRWEYVKVEGNVITLGPTTLSQSGGTPFLRLRHEFRPYQPQHPAPR
jgi:hypothetical protein